MEQNSSNNYNESKYGSCEYCIYYIYDEDYEDYLCYVNMDEDEMCRFMSSSAKGCPYFRLYDEYGTVRKQN